LLDDLVDAEVQHLDAASMQIHEGVRHGLSSHMLAVPGDAWSSPRRGRSDDDHLHVGSPVPVDRTHVACGQAGNEFLEEVTNDFRRLCHYFVVYG
jgi:hypothetical protein